VKQLRRKFWDEGIAWRLMTTFAVAASTVNVSADGFRLPDQDAFATARGEAFATTADNASAIYYNPAGISQLKGGNFRGGIYGIYLPVSYKSPSGRSFDNKKDLQASTARMPCRTPTILR